MSTSATQRKLQLSILDLANIYQGKTASETLQDSTELVQLAEGLGYTRYWFAEHHNAKTRLVLHLIY